MPIIKMTIDNSIKENALKFFIKYQQLKQKYLNKNS
jgi:hypothetical protein